VKLPPLEPCRVYLTRDLAQWSSTPSKLAAELIAHGLLKRAARGLYYTTKFGQPRNTWKLEQELARVYLKGARHLFTCHDQWRVLGLNVTIGSDVSWVYNAKVSGFRHLGQFTFEFFRRRFPDEPSREWFLVDLLNKRGQVSVWEPQLTTAVITSACESLWDLERLDAMAKEYGKRETRQLVENAIELAVQERVR
jgi:hypothetical protein